MSTIDRLRAIETERELTASEERRLVGLLRCKAEDAAPTEHEVLQDTAGWGGWPRLTCNSPGCDGATLVRQPYMTQVQWTAARERYLAAHPCAEIRREP